MFVGASDASGCSRTPAGACVGIEPRTNRHTHRARSDREIEAEVSEKKRIEKPCAPWPVPHSIGVMTSPRSALSSMRGSGTSSRHDVDCDHQQVQMWLDEVDQRMIGSHLPGELGPHQCRRDGGRCWRGFGELEISAARPTSSSCSRPHSRRPRSRASTAPTGRECKACPPKSQPLECVDRPRAQHGGLSRLGPLHTRGQRSRPGGIDADDDGSP